MGFYRGFLFCWNCGFDYRWVIRMTFAHTVSSKHAPMWPKPSQYHIFSHEWEDSEDFTSVHIVLCFPI